MSNVVNPIERVQIRGADVVVSEMAWPDAIEFLERLSSHFGRLMDAEGKLSIDTTQLASLITGTRELADLIVLRSTGMESAALNQLKPREVLALLDAAIPLNLSPQVMNLGKQVAGRVQDALGIKAPLTSLVSSTPSSGPATDSAKSGG